MYVVGFCLGWVFVVGVGFLVVERWCGVGWMCGVGLGVFGLSVFFFVIFGYVFGWFVWLFVYLCFCL